MKRVLYSASPVIAAVALPLTASANAFCDAFSNCVTVACATITLAGCVGGWIVGSVIW